MPVYLNGRWLKAQDACVSVMDRGFLFGDGVYEVIPVYSRRPFRVDEHLRRLQQSLDGIRLANPLTGQEWANLVVRLAREAEWEDQCIYLQVTRGAMTVRNQAFPDPVKPTVLLMAEPMSSPTPAQLARGVAAISAQDIRWLRCDLKSTSLLANCLLRQMAVDAGCAETVLFRDGLLTEGSVSSIFVVQGGVLRAPAKSRLVLPGITYDVILELAAAHNVPVELRDITEAEVRHATELWLASSTREVQAIVNLDGTPVKDGVPGPLFKSMSAWYQAYKAGGMRRDGA